MKFAIRDDDICYSTKPEELEKVYGKIWGKIPVSLSVIPFHKKSPIGDNKKLVSFLKKKIKENKISIMLHGYSHKDNPRGHEFEIGKDLYRKVKEGKRHLEQLFDVDITTFVPPHNALSRKGLRAVVRNKLNIIGVSSFRLTRRDFGFGNIVPYLRMKSFSLRYGRIYPYVLDFGNHKEANFHSLNPPVKYRYLKKELDFVHKVNGVFILSTHYWEILKHKQLNKDLKLIINQIKKLDNIKTLTVNGIFGKK